MKSAIGIRREDKNIWERRVPLIPSHVKELISDYSLDIVVQPSSIRIFSDEDYMNAGAEISESLASCPMVLAVKEIPEKFFLEGNVYAFFSHTIKGQEFNMPMLRRMMELRCTLIDYEKIMDHEGRRLVFFGIQAGQAGMIETFSALGRRLKVEGVSNPFENIRQAYQYASLVDAKESIQAIGWEIHTHGLPESCVPLICGFAGYGRVSQGAQDIFDLLPFESIEPGELEDFLTMNKSFSPNKVYKVVFEERHMVCPIGDTVFDLNEYYTRPERYESVFSKYLPHLSVLVNAIYWAPQYPRFVTRQDLKNLFESSEPPRLKVIGDITCDIDGSLASTLEATDPDNPTYVYDPITNSHTMGVTGRGVVVMAIDNLPCEIALESSIAFSDALKSFIAPLASADFRHDFSQCALPDEIKRAVILYQGKLTEPFAYMKKYIQSNSEE